MAKYDEDLHENVFFQTLVGKYGSLFREAAENKWMICVPRVDTVGRLKLTLADFENHILRQIEGSKFRSLSNKLVDISGDTVTVGEGYKEARSIKILFDEFFFNSRDECYSVFCLEQPLEGASSDDTAVIKLESLSDCVKFLWEDSGSEKVKKSIDRLCQLFEIQKSSLRTILDAASAVYNRAVQEVFKLSNFRRYQSGSYRSFCKLAVETYVMSGLHEVVFKEICFHSSSKDVALNKICRNQSDTLPQFIGIKPAYRRTIPRAAAVLSRQLNTCTTPLDKLFCLKKCISVLTSTSVTAAGSVLSADELVPMLVYLVIASEVPNWFGNLHYISKFHFSNVGLEEFSYYVTSFEAAVEYVKKDPFQGASFSMEAASRVYSSNSVKREEPSPVALFFQSISEGNVNEVRRLLEQSKLEAEGFTSQLCHPLCDCQKCWDLQSKHFENADHVTVYSRDSNGRTCLHYAALTGHEKVVDVLLEHRAIVNTTDHCGSTPLHLACQKGHQKCTLLLMDNDNSTLNSTDNSGNTALHLACSNGHEECVKALLFQKKKCNINCVNSRGDTPLHNATRWGYYSIVWLLLEHGANAEVQNKQGETSLQCAQSRKVQEIFSKAEVTIPRSVVGTEEKSTLVKSLTRRKRSDALSVSDKQVKKLFRAVQDGDMNYVCYIFGWSEKASTCSSSSDVDNSTELCHPLCQCERCIRVKKGGFLTVDSCDSKGITTLHKAAFHGHRGMVQLLLKHSAAINVKTKDDMLSPLHLACQYNHKDVVLVLLEHGAEVNPRGSQDNTPLHFCCSNGHIESATILLIHGADVTVANRRGDTPLHNAARWNHPMIVNELLLYGAQFSVTNKEGKTPLQLTKDEEVHLTIEKAMKGEIEVGSYKKPIVPRNISPPSEVSGLQQPSRIYTLHKAIEGFDRNNEELKQNF